MVKVVGSVYEFYATGSGSAQAFAPCCYGPIKWPRSVTEGRSSLFIPEIHVEQLERVWLIAYNKDPVAKKRTAMFCPAAATSQLEVV